MHVLLHACCAPCSIECIDALRKENFTVEGFWFNPNIHPFTEYQARKNAFFDYAKGIDLPVHSIDEYGLRPFLNEVGSAFDERCETCYRMRLYKTAQYAKENGFDAFTTTLFISPYQNHELMQQTGEAAAKKYGVEFIHRDFRAVFREGQRKARGMELYMQKYCGCIFSEEDRYSK